MNRRTFLRCLPAAPAAVAATPATALQMGQPDETDEADEALYQCEGCSKDLFEGDRAHYCSDGPVLCEDCAPTWADIAHEYDEAEARGEFEDLFDDPDMARLSRETVNARIADGDADKKHVWPL